MFLQTKPAGSLQGQTVTRELEADSGPAGFAGSWVALLLPSLSLGREHLRYPSHPGRGTPKGEGGTRWHLARLTSPLAAVPGSWSRRRWLDGLEEMVGLSAGHQVPADGFVGQLLRGLGTNVLAGLLLKQNSP